jgi:hypothetical protein
LGAQRRRYPTPCVAGRAVDRDARGALHDYRPLGRTYPRDVRRAIAPTPPRSQRLDPLP